jgi:hypothetical protein
VVFTRANLPAGAGGSPTSDAMTTDAVTTDDEVTA